MAEVATFQPFIRLNSFIIFASVDCDVSREKKGFGSRSNNTNVTRMDPIWWRKKGGKKRERGKDGWR